MPKNLQLALALVILVTCLIGCMLLSVSWQLSSWPVVIYLGQFTLAVIGLCTLGGALAESFLGRRKSWLSNLLGGVLMIVLLGGSAMLHYWLSANGPADMNTWERTTRMMALCFGSGPAVILGRSIIRRISKTPDG